MDYQYKEPIIPITNDMTNIEQIFARRGIAPNQISHYLKTTDDDIFSPNLLDNIDPGIRILAKHISSKSRILMIVDCDVDGYTSASLLVNYLNNYFPYFIQNYIDFKFHEGKQHGIEDEFIQPIINAGYSLVICADSSSNDYEQHKSLKDAGIDVLVLDHHEAERVSSDACVINNQLCDYPTKTLSGVGIVYKFCCEFDKYMPEPHADDFLDLVALGCVSDMEPLTDFETKHLIWKGLNNIHNAFMKEIEKNQAFPINRGGGMNPYAISFSFAPLINALIRVGSQQEKTILFLALLDHKGYVKINSTAVGRKGKQETIVEQAYRNCVNAKNRQNKLRDAGLENIYKHIEENNLAQNKVLLIKAKPEWRINKNITGLIANIIMNKYKRPTLILNQTMENGKIAWEGSARGCVISNFNNFKSFMSDSGYSLFAEGHANAFGTGILEEDIEDFLTYSNNALRNMNFTTYYDVDFIWQANDFSSRDVMEISDLGNIWGQNFDKPYIVLKNLRLSQSNVQLLNKGVMKITLPNGVELVKMKTTEDEFNTLKPSTPYGENNITIIGYCQKNEWGGRVTPQISIEDYEIVSQQLYSF